VGLQLPARTGSTRRTRRLSLLALLSLGLVVLTGCSGEGERFGMPDPITEQGESILSLWQGAWIAALITGAVVWGLIFYASWRFRRRNDDEIPIQTRYNLPLEIFYTIFPVIMVIVFFSHTVRVQNEVLDEEPTPDHEVVVVGQQWSWTFNYPHESTNGSYVWESGTGNYVPTLVIPVGETTKFFLESPDVIHNFGVPGFLMRMDVLPGQDNSFQVTPTKTGTYQGRCYELCGTHHARMLFHLEVVEPEDFEAALDALAAKGQVSDEPLTGGNHVEEQAGLDGEPEEGQSE
jgi:cytochrome c oxidase subunit 2